MTTDTPPPAPQPTSDKKGLSGWAWVAIGCGGLIALAFVVFVGLSMFVFQKGKELAKEATGVESLDELVDELQENPAKTYAEMAVRMNPDLEVISTDDRAGTITFKNLQTDEIATLNFKEIAEGRISMVTDEGEYSVSAGEGGEGGVTLSGPEGETRIGASASLDDVPDWVPLYPGGEETLGTFSSRGEQGVSGVVSMQAAGSAQEILDHYKEWFEENDWEIGTQSMTSSGDGAYAGITGELADKGLSLNVSIVEQGGALQITINYNAENE